MAINSLHTDPIGSLAKAVRYNKQELSRMVQDGRVDPTQALLASMRIDRMSQPQVPMGKQPTVLQQQLAPQQAQGIGQLTQGQPQAQQAPAQQPQQAPQQMAQADSGVAGLPIKDDMYSEQSMAAGGIVAFSERGEVPKPIGGTGITPGYNYYTAPAGSPDIDAQVKAGIKLAVENTVKKMRANLPLTADEKKLLSDNGFINAQTGPTAAAPQFVPGTEPKPSAPLAATPAADLNAAKPDAELKKDVPAKDDRFKPYAEVDRLKDNKLNSTKGSIFNRDEFVPKQKTMEDVEKERTDAYTRAGISEDPYATGLAGIAGKRAKIESDKENAKGMALAGIAASLFGARKGQEFQVASESIQKAIPQYGATLDRLTDRADRIDDKEQSLILARNQYKKDSTDKNLDRVHKSEDEVNAARRDYAKTEFDAKTKMIQLELQQDGVNVQRFSANTQRMIAERPDMAAEIINAAKSDDNYKKLNGMQKAEYLEKLAAMGHTAGTGSKGFTYLKELEASFNESTTPMGKEYMKLYKTQGLEAANKWKKTQMADAAKSAGIPYGDYLNQSTGSASAGKVVDFNSLP